MYTLALILYIVTITFCLSTYAFYPMIIWLLCSFFPLIIQRKEIIPTISIIIPAYNEEKNISEKISNSLALDYPKDKIEILVGSDGSSDNTVGIARKFTQEGIRVYEFNENRGKTAVQNALVKKATGEILVFTDTASFFPPSAVAKIVSNFADDRIGCVAGKLRFVNTDSNLTTQSQGLYWRYEVKIRELESKIGSVIGVDGPLYAIKREYYVPLGNNLISDLISPLLVLEQRKKIILEPEAIVDEEPTIKAGQEFNTRRRITLRGLIGITTYSRLLNPFKNPLLAFQLLFHKVLRWFVGPFVLLNILSCIILSNLIFFRIMLLLYLCFISVAFFGMFTERAGIRARFLQIPYYFTLVNLAATMGIIDFLRKKQAISWTPVRE